MLLDRPCCPTAWIKVTLCPCCTKFEFCGKANWVWEDWGLAIVVAGWLRRPLRLSEFCWINTWFWWVNRTGKLARNPSFILRLVACWLTTDPYWAEFSRLLVATFCTCWICCSNGLWISSDCASVKFSSLTCGWLYPSSIICGFSVCIMKLFSPSASSSSCLLRLCSLFAGCSPWDWFPYLRISLINQIS